MKTIYTSLLLLLAFLLTSEGLFAQTIDRPFNYQAVLRNASGQVMSGESVTLRFSIYENATNPTDLVYRESHSLTTSDQGLVNAWIGDGTADQGTFTAIDWAAARHYFKVELDDNGSWREMSNNELNAVPYAKVADEFTNYDWQKGTYYIINKDQTKNVFVNDVSITAKGSINAISIDSMMMLTNDGENTFVGTNSAGQLFVKTNNGLAPPVLIIDNNGGPSVTTNALTIEETTTAPQPYTLYGNSMPIAYAYVNGSTPSLIYSNYGVQSVTKPSLGVYVIQLDADLTALPVVHANAIQNTGVEFAMYSSSNITSNTVTIKTYNLQGNPVTTDFTFVIYGDIAP